MQIWRLMPNLLERLRNLEIELHHPGVCLAGKRLEALLHPDFHEVGRSGLPYDRATIISYLGKVTVPPLVISDAFAVAELAPGVALLTYRSANRDADGGLSNHTLRSSLWLEGPAGWQLRYHQGTPAATPW